MTQEQYDKIKEVVDTILTNMDVDMLKIIRYLIYTYIMYYVIYIYNILYIYIYIYVCMYICMYMYVYVYMLYLYIDVDMPQNHPVLQANNSALIQKMALTRQ